jgi:hypothetical protein
MGFKNDFLNYPVKVFFSNTIRSGDANDFVVITTDVLNVNTSLANVGFLIKNIGTDSDCYFFVKHSNNNHGSNTGFRVNIGESIFVECNNISDVYIKSNTDQTISYQVIGN